MSSSLIEAGGVLYSVSFAKDGSDLVMIARDADWLATESDSRFFLRQHPNLGSDGGRRPPPGLSSNGNSCLATTSCSHVSSNGANFGGLYDFGLPK